MNTMTKNEELQRRLQERTTHVEEDTRGSYFRDQTKIIHSLAFRRLKDKTQVVSDPTDDHVCTRVEHVLHVATVAKSICRGLNDKKDFGVTLDEDLAFAIGLGHDLGHAPFGHAGEKAICTELGDEKAFMHELNGYRVVEQLDRLNLTYAVKDGIICHNGEKFERCIKPREESEPTDLSTFKDRSHMPATYEGCIVRFSDKIAYLGRDIEDALMTGLIRQEDLNEKLKANKSLSNRSIISNSIADLVRNSSAANGLCFSDEWHSFMIALKEFNYANIYDHPRLAGYKEKCNKVIKLLYEEFRELYANYDWVTKQYKEPRYGWGAQVFADYLNDKRAVYEHERSHMDFADLCMKNKVVTDFIAGMTDRFALACAREYILPESI